MLAGPLEGGCREVPSATVWCVWAGPLEGGCRKVPSGESRSVAIDLFLSSWIVVSVISPQYAAAGPLLVVGVGIPIVEKFQFSTSGRDELNDPIS